MERKKRIAWISLIVVLLICLCACGQVGKEMTWQEQYDLGVRYLEEGDYEEAIIAFTAAIEIDPKRAEAYVGRGDAYVLSGESRRNLRAAQKDYETAMELDETLAEAYLGLADVYIRRGDNDKALEILQQGYEKTKDSDKLTEKIEEIEREGIAGKNEAPIDILSGFWKSNGYRLSDTYVYQFRPDGTYICQVGMMSIPFYGNYEYNGHTLTLIDEFYHNEEVYEYDTEKQCFISSNTTVMVEQDSDNAEGVFKYAEKTLSFQAEAPIGFFEDEADGYDPTASGNVQGEMRGPYPVDCIGMTVDSLARIWGEDYQLADYWYGGAAKPIYYSDWRVPMTFYFLDPELTSTAYGNEEIIAVEFYPGVSAEMNEIAPGVPTEGTYYQLADLGYYGELSENVYGDDGETSTYYLEYSPEISIHFSWFDDNDPRTTLSESVWILKSN